MKMIVLSLWGTRRRRRSVHIDTACCLGESESQHNRPNRFKRVNGDVVLSSDTTATAGFGVGALGYSLPLHLRITGDMVRFASISATRVEEVERVTPWGQDGAPCGPEDP
jgi:hypothetical protein